MSTTTIICLDSRTGVRKPQKQRLNPQLPTKGSRPSENPIADIVASYTAVTLTIESACTSAARELIGAGSDRLDFQKRYATCNLKLPGRLKW